MLSAIGGFNVGMFAEPADNNPFLWLAKQGVLVYYQFWSGDADGLPEHGVVGLSIVCSYSLRLTHLFERTRR